MTPPDLPLLLSSAGWAGALGTIAAYALLSRRRLASDSRAFQGTNAVGAAMLALSAASAGSWPSTFVNVLWALIGAHSLVSAGLAARRETVTGAVVGWASPATSARGAGTPAHLGRSLPAEHADHAWGSHPADEAAVGRGCS